VPAPRSALSRVSEPLPEPKPQSPAIERTLSFPDLENYDPTYGLRPEGLPSKSGYSGLGRLFSPAKGFADLGDVTEERASVAGGANGEEGTEYDVVEWKDAVPDYSTHPPSVAGESEVEFETLPAVGGGTITRPRVVHSQSMGVASDTVSRTSRPASTARSALPTPSTSRPHSHTPRNGSQTHLHRSTLQRLDGDSSPPDPVTTWRDQQMREQQRGSFNPYFPEMGVAGPSKLGPGRPSASSYQASIPGGDYHHHHPRMARHLSHAMDDAQRQSRRQSATSDVRLSSSSSYTRLSHSSGGRPPTVSTPPSSDRPPDDDAAGGSPMSKEKERHRRRSLSPSIIQPFDSFHFGSPPRAAASEAGGNPKIVLRPHANMTVSHLSALSASYHTLSPYTHSVEHFTVRSLPPKPPQTPTVLVQGAEKGGVKAPVRARRKRMIRLGAKKDTAPKASGEEESRRTSPHVAPSEFSDEVDHYFRPGDDAIAGLRQRFPYEQVT
ncbi:ERMES complex subunit, partial [Tulasnella sp. 427]